MRTSDGYRFSLQFKAQSDAHRQAGEYLEHLGNKKSEAVVTALIEYLQAHPEAPNSDNQVHVIAAHGFSEETLSARIEDAVRKIVGERSLNLQCDAQMIELGTPVESPDDSTNALDALLSGLDVFK